MARTVIKKRTRPAAKPVSRTGRGIGSLDAEQMKQLVKQAVREVLQEERRALVEPSAATDVAADWLEEARRVRRQSPALSSSVDLVRTLREERASR